MQGPPILDDDVDGGGDAQLHGRAGFRTCAEVVGWALKWGDSVVFSLIEEYTVYRTRRCQGNSIGRARSACRDSTADQTKG